MNKCKKTEEQQLCSDDISSATTERRKGNVWICEVTSVLKSLILLQVCMFSSVCKNQTNIPQFENPFLHIDYIRWTVKFEFKCSFLVVAVRRTQTDNVSINDIDTDCCYDRYLYIILNEGLCWEAHVSASQWWQCTTQKRGAPLSAHRDGAAQGLADSVWRNHVKIHVNGSHCATSACAGGLDHKPPLRKNWHKEPTVWRRAHDL